MLYWTVCYQLIVMSPNVRTIFLNTKLILLTNSNTKGVLKKYKKKLDLYKNYTKENSNKSRNSGVLNTGFPL